MKFLLKAFLLFTLIVVGKLAKQPLTYVNLVAEKPQTVVGTTSTDSHTFFVQQVSHKSGGYHQAPGTPPSSSGDQIFTIE
ncbi:hypothetical protein PK28_03860 [Hymenobacter sp. DG25B]|jgi:hypothetical protein|nr:hypothetical protein PK28_03860 [Hymenobacter sp. DG25B]